MKTRKEAPLKKDPGQRKSGRVEALEARLRKAEGALAEAAQAETRREAYLAKLNGLVKVSGELCAARSVQEMLPRVIDAGRELAGARLAVGAYGYRNGRFTVRVVSRAPDTPPFPDDDVFDGDGGVYMDFVGRNRSVRLTDDELKNHPLTQAVRDKGREVPLRGLLGVCLTDTLGAGQGVIIVSDKNEGDFTPEDETLLSQLADFASLGIQHIEARIEAEQRACEVRQARDDLDTRVRERTAELKGAYEALQAETRKGREAEEGRVRLVAAIEEAAEGVAVISTTGVVQYVNPAFSRITGYEQAEVVGKNVGILGRVDANTYVSFMTTIMGGNTWSGRLSGTRKDGTAYELEVVMSPVRDASGQIINYAALSRDVTDEELLASAARMMLERLGYEVTAVTSSTEAWHIFLGDPKRFDLVITDQTMPGMTGTMLAQKILRVRKDMPIILYTGHSDTVSPEKAQSLGIRAFSMKPVVRGELARTVRRVLDGGPT